ncbi:hypothetical protein CLOP_g13474 [Closterium sp. NIES-67]|nr:hypothetical protein CLOP_g13474 [Closterium sp. NIES-67]
MKGRRDVSVTQLVANCGLPVTRILHDLLQGLIKKTAPYHSTATAAPPAPVPTADSASDGIAEMAAFNADVDAAAAAMSADELEQMDMRIIMEVDDWWVREKCSG